ncbi:MAG: hypothetical protein AB7L76_18260 [Burkholderiaceae bacterium]
MTAEHHKPWQPLPLRHVAALFEGAPFPWWIAGGHAIECFVGRALRPHGDIDVLLLRRDREQAREWLADWDCWAADPPGTLRRWPRGEALGAAVSDVWCREPGSSAWRLQLMLDDGDDHEWRSRHCAAVSRPLPALGFHTADGVPVLAPEVQLFYKARQPRPKDEADLAAALPRLDPARIAWLRQAIITAYGPHNDWLGRLGDFGSVGPVSDSVLRGN